VRIVTLPAAVLGIALTILFFKLYGVITRPSVPLPVSVVIGQFAPGVEIGKSVTDARHGVAAMTYVRHLGFVGVPNSHGPNMPDGGTIDFAQVRLLIDEPSRTQVNPNPARTRVDAVEVVTANRGAQTLLNELFTGMLRRAPREGCLHTADPSRLRTVQIWTTPNERGGFAMTSDYRRGRIGYAADPGLTNLLAFVGKFQGARTLRADYSDANCSQIAEPT
jgi:hypothetical protein